ncbi:helicase-related protein [Sphingorhabdus sp.]|uniref:helicase-related protein n=1 Tax=Sphingorhabdus sp. TaxID=1902408 RepID=UPI003593373D
MATEQDKFPDRELLVQRLEEDLIGPRTLDEILTSRPSDVYLTGILWPRQTEIPGEQNEKLAVDGSDDASASIDAEQSEVPASSIQRPAAAGLSFCAMSQSDPSVRVLCRFGRYDLIRRDEVPKKTWVRSQVEVVLTEVSLRPGSRFIDLPETDPRAAGGRLHVRALDGPAGRLATITLLNNCAHDQGRDEAEASILFQTSLEVTPNPGTTLVARPARRAPGNGDFDERSAALLFRDVAEFAAGHTCSALWDTPEVGESFSKSVPRVRTSWLPEATVAGVDSRGHAVFRDLVSGVGGMDPLSAKDLAEAGPADLEAALVRVCAAYGCWIGQQRQALLSLSGDLLRAAEDNLVQCDRVRERMSEAAVRIAQHPRLRRAFQLANLAMHVQHGWDGGKAAHGTLRWRPFQLGFLLLSATSSAEKGHPDRKVMDLLWFPTGGGKTEAYLALVAFVSFYRRLGDEESDGKGVAAVMRYTLRLLTTQQFARAAAMMLACEAIRCGRIQAPGQSLNGNHAFSIGLWVGGDASPNRLVDSFASLKGSREVSSPKQLAICPACHQQLRWRQEAPTTPVIVSCETGDCVLSGELPVWTVDEDVYRERPTLLIGTIDKFAQIVRKTEVHDLFGIGTNATPDLVIQDELHLISGPLGTIAGVYEVAIDLMFASGGSYPKVIGSTATIRRAAEQVKDLFDREACQFPPSAINHDDSGFAVNDPNSTGRRYVGVSTAGRSAKFTLQAVAGSLLQSAFGAFSDNTRRDPYWTLVGYFNSLRELGGALVLMQDDVSDTVRLLAEARGEKARTSGSVEELTSRRSQDEILEMLTQLGVKVGEVGALDSVLATNMVSVGVDIPRLGLMVVNGQPKSTAEYIQSTSRVGRGSISGLVVALLNNAKARDRSHFETFPGWHQTLYRDVEATSVTPFASRSRDRALHAALVAGVRHLIPGMLDHPSLNEDTLIRIDALIELIVARAGRIDGRETAVARELRRRINDWVARAPEHYWQDRKLGRSLLQSAERAATQKALGRRPGDAWPTMNNMRSVEAGTPFRLASVLRGWQKNGE